MPPINPTDPKDEIRHVVIEPPKLPQTRLKQYVTLQSLTIDDNKYNTHELVMLSDDEAIPLLAGFMITPLNTASREGIYPPKHELHVEKAVDKLKHVVKEVVGLTDTPEETATGPESKSFLGNKLREAVQERKVETAKIDAAKLAAIKAGGNK